MLEQRHGRDALADGGGATSLAGGCGMATMSTLETTDNGDVVVGLGAWWADSAWVPPVSYGGFWKNFLFNVACFVALFALGNLDIFFLVS